LTAVRLSRAALSLRGFQECVTYSFMPKNLAEQFGSNDNALSITNPISSDMDQMRPSILGNLISAAQTNFDKGQGDSQLFEVGPVYMNASADGQRMIATALRFGAVGARHWVGKEASRENDIYDAKADALATLQAAGVSTSSLQTSREASEYFHPGRSGVLKMGNKILAQFGEIHPAILAHMDIKEQLVGQVVGMEVFLDAIPTPKKKGTARPLLKSSAFQPVSRDFAFIVDEQVEAESLIRAAKGTDRNLISNVSIFDVYQGKGVEEGKKSLALNVEIQPIKQTLTDAEIDGLGQKIIDAVASKTGGILRG